MTLQRLAAVRPLLALTLIASVAVACSGGTTAPSASSAGAPSAPTTASVTQAAPSATPAASTCQASGQKVELTYWGWHPSQDALVKAFNDSHPLIHVTAKTITAADYQSIYNALKAGTAPDAGLVEYTELPGFRLANGLADISACPGVAEMKDKLVPWTWSQVTFGGSGVYAMPWGTAAAAMYYRKDVFDKLGLTLPTTWAEYYDVAKKIRAADKSTFVGGAPDGQLLLSLLWQAGARPFVYQGSGITVDFKSAQAAQVADYWQKMIAEGLVNKSVVAWTPAWQKALADGQLATLISATWMCDFIKQWMPDIPGKWAVAPLPQWDPSAPAGMDVGGGSNAVFATTKHPAEAAEFVTWMAINGAEAVLPGTAYLPGQSLPRMTAPDPYFGGQVIGDVFRQADATVATDFQWPPNAQFVMNSLNDGLAGVLNGTTTLSEALAVVQDKVVQNLQSSGITVTVSK